MQYLRASQEAKVETERNMTAYFAHELRNPLGAIDSALNAMPDELPEAARSLISGMQLCTGFMSSIMNNLLDVRKMEEGKMKLSKIANFPEKATEQCPQDATAVHPTRCRIPQNRQHKREGLDSW